MYSIGAYYSADKHIVEEETSEDMIRDVTFFDLIASFKFAIERMPKKFIHEIEIINIICNAAADKFPETRSCLLFINFSAYCSIGNFVCFERIHQSQVPVEKYSFEFHCLGVYDSDAFVRF
jgi:hypothetical protein